MATTRFWATPALEAKATTMGTNMRPTTRLPMKFVMMAESSMMRNTKSTVPVPSPKRGVSQAEIWSLMPVPALVSAEVATTAKARIIIVSQGMPSLKVLARDTKELPFFLIRKPAMTRRQDADRGVADGAEPGDEAARGGEEAGQEQQDEERREEQHDDLLVLVEVGSPRRRTRSRSS